jgi:hypothetical protein
MAQKRNIMGSGVPAGATEFIVGKCNSALTATGTSATDALPLVDVNEFTTVASSTGAILPAGASPGDQITLYNIGAQTLTVYPPTGETINNAASSYTVATTKVGIFTKVSNTRWCAGVLA